MRGAASWVGAGASLAALLALLACEDPAKNKAKAVTGAAKSESVAAPAGEARDYRFDQAGSKVGWIGSKVTGKHEGSFGSFRGVVHVVDGNPEKSSVTVDIDTASLATDNEKLAGHLRSPDFFDVAKYPNATFASTEVHGNTVTGNLTLHGVTKAITFPATIKIAGDDVAVDSEFAINRKDFGLTYPGKPDDLIRDDVVIELAIRAKRPES